MKTVKAGCGFGSASSNKVVRGVVGFTLVELLVVIGIIALLISILLPALSSARRQAMQVKCASNLQQCGIALKLYADAYRGYGVPIRVGGGVPGSDGSKEEPSTNTGSAVPYELFGVQYGAKTEDPTANPPQTVNAAWWPEFLAHFLGTAKGGQGDWYSSGGNSNLTEAQRVALARQSVFWCPAWQAPVASNNNQPLYTGYTMNYMVSITPSNPPSPTSGSGPHGGGGGSASEFTATVYPPANWFNIELSPAGSSFPYVPTSGKWYQLTQITMQDQRCFMADATSLFLECWQPPNSTAANSGIIPPPQNVLPATGGGGPFTGGGSPEPGWTGQNSFDCYRHGVYPPVISGWAGANGIAAYSSTGLSFSPSGGKVAYNILYFDGHVATTSDRSDSYRSVRMRYPN